MRKIIRIIICVLLVIAVSFSCKKKKQEDFGYIHIYGRVTDAITGQPLNGVNVYAIEQCYGSSFFGTSNHTSGSTNSDANGNYDLRVNVTEGDKDCNSFGTRFTFSTYNISEYNYTTIGKNQDVNYNVQLYRKTNLRVYLIANPNTVYVPWAITTVPIDPEYGAQSSSTQSSEAYFWGVIGTKNYAKYVLYDTTAHVYVNRLDSIFCNDSYYNDLTIHY